MPPYPVVSGPVGTLIRDTLSKVISSQDMSWWLAWVDWKAAKTSMTTHCFPTLRCGNIPRFRMSRQCLVRITWTNPYAVSSLLVLTKTALRMNSNCQRLPCPNCKSSSVSPVTKDITKWRACPMWVTSTTTTCGWVSGQNYPMPNSYCWETATNSCRHLSIRLQDAICPRNRTLWAALITCKHRCAIRKARLYCRQWVGKGLRPCFIRRRKTFSFNRGCWRIQIRNRRASFNSSLRDS